MGRLLNIGSPGISGTARNLKLCEPIGGREPCKSRSEVRGCRGRSLVWDPLLSSERLKLQASNFARIQKAGVLTKTIEHCLRGSGVGSRDLLSNFATPSYLGNSQSIVCGAFDAAFAKLLRPLVNTTARPITAPRYAISDR